MSETEEERLDPFVLNAKLAAASSHRQRIAAANARRLEPSSANPPASLGSAGGLRGAATGPVLLPCRVDNCKAAVPRKYP